jgi:hypothetical protein
MLCGQNKAALLCSLVSICVKVSIDGMLSMRECAQSNIVQQKSLPDQQRLYCVGASRPGLKGFIQVAVLHPP